MAEGIALKDDILFFNLKFIFLFFIDFSNYRTTLKKGRKNKKKVKYLAKLLVYFE